MKLNVLISFIFWGQFASAQTSTGLEQYSVNEKNDSELNIERNKTKSSSINQNIKLNNSDKEVLKPAFVSSAKAGCASLEVDFIDVSNGNPTCWYWTFPGGTPNSSTKQNPTIMYSAEGLYKVKLAVANAKANHSISHSDYISIETSPSTAFSSHTLSNTVTFVNYTIGANSYQWDFGDGNASTAANPLHTYTEKGTFVITLTATNACGSDVHQESIEIKTSALQEKNRLASLAVLPNPNNGFFKLELLGEPLDQIEIQVFSITGVKVYERLEDFSAGSVVTDIDLSDLSPGTYLLAIRNGAEKAYRNLTIIE